MLYNKKDSLSFKLKLSFYCFALNKLYNALISSDLERAKFFVKFTL